MSLDGVRDEFLARRAQKGDEAAFAELARRYEPLLGGATWRPSDGLDVEDARQAALIGLYDACRETDGLRSFAGLAKLRVEWTVAAARRTALTYKHRLVTDAIRDGGAPEGALAWLAAAEGTDPARLVELREELRERWRAHQERERRRSRAPAGDLRRRHSEELIARAVALVIAGSTVAAAATAVDVPYRTAYQWVTGRPEGRAALARRAGPDGARWRRRHGHQQVARALAMVAAGSSVRRAAKAVGASHGTVLRWMREAA